MSVKRELIVLHLKQSLKTALAVLFFIILFFIFYFNCQSGGLQILRCDHSNESSRRLLSNGNVLVTAPEESLFHCIKNYLDKKYGSETVKCPHNLKYGGTIIIKVSKEKYTFQVREK